MEVIKVHKVHKHTISMMDSVDGRYLICCMYFQMH